MLIENLNHRLSELEAQALRRQRRAAESPCSPRQRVSGRDLLAFSSNDYLGLANHPALVDALVEGTRLYGAGSGASHLMIRPPTVPVGTARLRITVSAAHTPQDVQGLLDGLAYAVRAAGAAGAAGSLR